MFELLDFMPEQASSWAARVDWINNLISIISLLCTVGITAVMIYFAVKYRRRSEEQKTEFITHNTVMETVWTIIPTLVVIYIFVYGFIVYKEMRTPPASAMEVNVDAYQWRWEYTYPSGKKATKDLVVPLGRPVRLIMRSHDVLHSFFLPEMRVKEDLRANEYSYLWFTPTKLGNFHIFCAEYCGLQHSAMAGTLKVVTPEQFEDYLRDRTAADAVQLPPAEAGKELFSQKTCNTCHSIDGSKIIGPSLKGLFASGAHQFSDGSSGTVDENYVRQSILQSQAKVVAGYPPVMPSFEGQLTEKQVSDLIAYLKTL